ncbi:unnamed protein product, partial [Tenebrio molitor]
NTPGFGIEYEVLIPAYFALKLNKEDNVEDFLIQSNVENMGNLDDVVIDVTTNEKQVSFAIQLKHKNNKNKRLSPETLEKENGDFSLKKYCETFKAEVTNFTMIQDDCCDGNMFFNTTSGGGNVYRFEVNDKTPENGKITKSDYEIFFSRFRLFACQKYFKDIELEMAEILQIDTIHVVPKFLDLFRKWHQDRFTNKKIDKATVNVHLIDIFLSPFIISDRYFSIGQNENLKLFEKVIKEFDVTLVNDSFDHFKENLTDDFNPEEGTEEMFKSYKKLYKIEPNANVHECIMRLAKEIKIIDKYVTVLENEVKMKVLQYLFEKPIIVKFNETSEELIYKIMELHQLGSKIKFIVVGQGIQSVRLSRFRIFANVNGLRSNDQLYTEVTRTCRLSLQGRKETTLEVLIDSCKEICEHVGAKELLQMLKGKFLIGQAAESLPSFYINREVCFKVEKIDAFLDDTFFENNLAVVKFDREMEMIQNEIRKRKIKVVDVHDYLKSTQISNEPTIILTNEECSEQLLQDVSEKSDNKSVVYLRISEDNDFLIVSIEENQLPRLTRPVNILCADPGMGKTTLLKKLRNECDSRFWTIDVDLKTYNEFFKTKHDVDEVRNRLIEGNENNFSKHIRDVFRSKKKVYFFFDGLDEMENSCVDNVLDSVNELSDVEDILEIYEHLAVHSVFSEKVFQKLNVDLRRAQRFLNEIKTNKDPFGIATKVNDEGKAVFEHFTYGEYFAARFFSSNFDKAHLIREELFSDGHKNLMMILNVILAEDNPLHFAVIYRNVDQIANHIENENVYDKAGRNPLHLATYVE